jgi:hypothetical protein
MIRAWIALAMAFGAFSAPEPFAVQFAQSVQGKRVTVCIDGRKVETTFVGKLGFRDKSHSWLSLCANIRGPVRQGQFFLVRPVSSLKAGGNVSLAGNIVAKCFALAQTPEQCAGLQLAVWEAIEDGGMKPNFGAGRFMARADAATLAFAEDYYRAVEMKGEALYLDDLKDQGQSQLTTL